jgi:hypothetical protein
MSHTQGPTNGDLAAPPAAGEEPLLQGERIKLEEFAAVARLDGGCAPAGTNQRRIIISA